jgi:8-oxo-dGTP diphosphatase
MPERTAESSNTAVTELIQVAAGVIIANNKVLLSLRHPEAHQGNKWEFPGGKLEQQESAEQALIRELKEELAIEVSAPQKLLAVEHQYSDKKVLIEVFIVEQFLGKPQGLEGQQIAWFTVDQLSELKFPDANYPILKAVSKYLND